MSQAERTTSVIGCKLRGGDSGRYHRLRGPGTLSLSTLQATLRIGYDPPATAWIAFALMLFSLALVVATSATGYLHLTVGPGFLPWYLVVRALRQRRIELPLNEENIQEAVVDPGSGLLAIRVSGQLGEHRLSDGWLGVRLSAPAETVPELERLWNSKLRRGAVHEGMNDVVLVVCVLALICIGTLIMAAVTATAMMKYSARNRQVQARVHMKQVEQAARRWMGDNPGCPNVTDLNSPHDQFGRPYRITCDGGNPSVRSAGPDGKFDTPDDLTTAGGP